MLTRSAASRVALLLGEELFDAVPVPRRAKFPRAALLLLFCATALHATRVTGSLATEAPVASRWTNSNSKVQGMTHSKKIGAAATIAALSIGSHALAQDAVQWRVEDGGNGHWYALLVSGPIDWPTARTTAISLGGDLATLTTQAEHFFALALVEQVPGGGESPLALYGPWLGGYQLADSEEPAGGWTWVSGEPWSYAPWLVAQPDNGGGSCEPEKCLHLIGHWAGPKAWGMWNDLPAEGCVDQVVSFVVEYSADCNADGIVDFGQILNGELDDANGNNIPDCCESSTSCHCVGDVIPDGSVDAVDLAAVLNQWGTVGDKQFNADVNSDGLVDASDLSILLNSWGACP